MTTEPIAPEAGNLEEYLEPFDARIRLVMRLRFNHDMSFRDIGLRLGIAEEQVRELHDQAIETLRGQLCRDE